jgi:hypothetical protein
MKPEELVKQLNDEHQALNRILANLKAVLEKNAGDASQWAPALTDEFEHLRAHLFKQMALKEAVGYFLPVVEQRPDKSEEVERLRNAQRQLRCDADATMTALRTADWNDADFVRRIRERVDELITRVRQQEKGEALLMQEVFNVDIGGKG